MPFREIVKTWWRREDSNLRHGAYETPALPPELRRRVGGPSSKRTGLRDRRQVTASPQEASVTEEGRVVNPRLTVTDRQPRSETVTALSLRGICRPCSADAVDSSPAGRTSARCWTRRGGATAERKRPSTFRTVPHAMGGLRNAGTTSSALWLARRFPQTPAPPAPGPPGPDTRSRCARRSPVVTQSNRSQHGARQHQALQRSRRTTRTNHPSSGKAPRGHPHLHRFHDPGGEGS